MTQAGLCSFGACGNLKEASSRKVFIPEEDNPDKLTLVLEPEAAAFYCQSMSQHDRAEYCAAEEPFESNNYLVVDVGGGTVDIAAYRVHKYPEPHMEVIREPTGGPWGGAKINAEFKTFLESVTEDFGFLQYIETGPQEDKINHKSNLDEIVNETFEYGKESFGNCKIAEKGKVSVRLHSSFVTCYKAQLEKLVSIEEEPFTKFYPRTDELRIGYRKLELLFSPTVDGITQHIAEVLDHVPNIHTIYLVGGFGGCRYIHLQLENHIPFKDKYKFITPREKDYAVVRGAAMMRKNPEFLKARRADATYGVRVRIPFITGFHDEEYRCSVPGKDDMCSDIFATFVEKGDVVCPDYVYEKTFYPERDDQKLMRVHIYSSTKKDVWYTTSRRAPHAMGSQASFDVEKIGELVIPFKKDENGTYRQGVDVVFDFSTAELKVTGRQHNSNTRVRLVLDFFES